MIIFSNSADVGLLILRLVIGIIFIYHSIPKIRNPSKMAMGMKWSTSTVMILGLAEGLSGLAAILGLFTQIAAIIIAIIMFGAIYMKTTKWKVPFYSTSSTGWEYDFMIVAAALALLFIGSGNLSIDSMLGIYS